MKPFTFLHIAIGLFTMAGAAPVDGKDDATVDQYNHPAWWAKRGENHDGDATVDQYNHPAWWAKRT